MFWGPPRFQAAKGQFSLKVWLSQVIFVGKDWTLGNYAVLKFCVICTLHFYSFPTQKEAMQSGIIIFIFKQNITLLYFYDEPVII